MGREGGEGVRGGGDKPRTGVLKPCWVSCEKQHHFVFKNGKTRNSSLNDLIPSYCSDTWV